MSVTDWHYPADCDYVYGGIGGAWVNPGNAEGESGFNDGNLAQFQWLSSTPGSWLRCYNFDYQAGELPEGVIIDGIEFQAKLDGGYAVDGYIRLRTSAGQVGDDKGNDSSTWDKFTTPGNYKVWGGETDGWNAGITRNDILNSAFGLDISTKWSESQAEVAGWVDGVKLRIWFSYPGAPVYLKGDLTGVFGKGGLLFGSLTAQLQYFGWILGNPVMQSFPKKPYIVGDVITTWGKKGFLQGSLNPYYGGGGYIVGTLTAIPYYPKPVAGSWFQRTGAVIEKIS